MQKEQSPVFIHLNLAQFKVYPCKNKKKHNAKLQKRRNILKYDYKKIMCKYKQNCPKKNKCSYSHNFIEQIYHPESYKKKFCKDFYTNKKCSYQQFCALAHCVEELKLKPLHTMKIDQNFLFFYFKSEFCPFSKIEHDRFTCVYAHNWQDYKRPWFQDLIPKSCQNWDVKKEIVEYQEGCKNSFSCRFCHGWKELEFHMNNFKKLNCKQKNCRKSLICSFKHQETYDYQEQVYNQFFYPVSSTVINSNQKKFRKYLDFIETQIPQQRFLQNRTLEPQFIQGQDFSTQVSQKQQNDVQYIQNNQLQVNQELLFFYKNFSKSVALQNSNNNVQSLSQQFQSVKNVENFKKDDSLKEIDFEEEYQILEEGSSFTISESDLLISRDQKEKSKDKKDTNGTVQEKQYLNENSNQQSQLKF